jgi:hypothetical protein
MWCCVKAEAVGRCGEEERGRRDMVESKFGLGQIHLLPPYLGNKKFVNFSYFITNFP